MNKKTIERIKRKRYEAALKAEREKAAKDPYYLPEIHKLYDNLGVPSSMKETF